MTDIAKLREDVIEAADALFDKLDEQPGLWRSVPEMRRFREAMTAKRAAEEAEKRPRLRPTWHIVQDHEPLHQRKRMNAYQPGQYYATYEEFLKALDGRDAEWMAAIRKLPTVRFNDPQHGVAITSNCVSLADIEALAESAK